MLKKVFLSESLDNSLFEVKGDFKDINIQYCTDLSFDQFIMMHQPNLLNTSGITCFIGVDKFKSDKLLAMLEADFQTNVVWVIGKLDKRKKLYKRLKKISNIEECSDLAVKKSKKAFLKKIFKEFNISTKHLDFFTMVSADNKQSVYNELRKFSIALKVMTEEEALGSVSIYKANFDVLDFITSLFECKDDCYLFAKKVETVPIQVLRATLIKRLNSYIALSLGNLDQAKTHWDRNGYYVQHDRSVANKYGFQNLLDITDYIDKVFSNFLTSDNSFLRLTKLIYFIEERRL